MTIKSVLFRAELRNWKLSYNSLGQINQLEGDVWEDSIGLWRDGERIKIHGVLSRSDYGDHYVVGTEGPGRSTYLLYKNSEKRSR